MKKPIDGSLQWMKPDGTPTQYFLEVIQSLDRNGLTMPVSKTAPANGDVLTFDGTANEWEPA